MNFIKTIPYLLFALFLSACSALDRDEPIPAYLEIDSIEVIIDTLSQGSSSHNISDAWVYIDDQNVGIYELPARIPIIGTGAKRLSIKAGIKSNGFSNTRITYPFYDFYDNDTSITLAPGETIHLNPVVRYYPDIQFPLIEDFEQAALKIDSASFSAYNISRTELPSEVFEGQASGKIEFNKGVNNDTLIHIKSTYAYVLPKTGVPVFIELNYKSNVEFEIGLISYHSTTGIPTEEFIWGVNPKLNKSGAPVWNKLYFELTTKVSAEESQDVVGFQISLYSKSEEGDSEVKTILLDNIKLIHSTF